MNKNEYKHYLKRLLVIAVPIILSNIIGQLQMIIDRIFLGRMNDYYMSSLGNVTAPMWTTMSFCYSLVIGASILISQGVGAGDTSNTEKYAASMMKWNNIIPLLLFFFWEFGSQFAYKIMGVSDNLMPYCLTYTRYYAPVFLIVGVGAAMSVVLQTSNYTKPLVAYGLIRSLTNVALDWILIFGHFGFPEMGIKGAAIATTLAEYIGLIAILPIYFFDKRLTTRPSMAAVVRSRIKPFLQSAKLGLNSACEDFAWNFGNLMLIRILNTINDLAAGIYSIVFSVEVLAVVVIGSLGNGTMTLTGEATGKKDLTQYRGVIQIAYLLSAITSILLLVCSILFPSQVIGLFTKDENIIASCGLYLILVSLNMFSKAGNIIVGNGIRGYGDTQWMFMTQIFGTCFVIGCASLFVFVFHLGIAGVFLAVMADEFVRVCINLSRLKFIEKNKFPQA